MTAEFAIDIFTQWLLLGRHQFLIPGFVDTHTHAPQYVNCGLGLDLPLLEWLERYTFPKETEFQDARVAEVGQRVECWLSCF